jgi:hypothetical protein
VAVAHELSILFTRNRASSIPSSVISDQHRDLPPSYMSADVRHLTSGIDIGISRIAKPGPLPPRPSTAHSFTANARHRSLPLPTVPQDGQAARCMAIKTLWNPAGRQPASSHRLPDFLQHAIEHGQTSPRRGARSSTSNDHPGARLPCGFRPIMKVRDSPWAQFATHGDTIPQHQCA